MHNIQYLYYTHANVYTCDSCVPVIIRIYVFYKYIKFILHLQMQFSYLCCYKYKILLCFFFFYKKFQHSACFVFVCFILYFFQLQQAQALYIFHLFACNDIHTYIHLLNSIFEINIKILMVMQRKEKA